MVIDETRALGFAQDPRTSAATRKRCSRRPELEAEIQRKYIRYHRIPSMLDASRAALLSPARTSFFPCRFIGFRVASLPSKVASKLNSYHCYRIPSRYENSWLRNCAGKRKLCEFGPSLLDSYGTAYLQYRTPARLTCARFRAFKPKLLRYALGYPAARQRLKPLPSRKTTQSRHTLSPRQCVRTSGIMPGPLPTIWRASLLKGPARHIVPLSANIAHHLLRGTHLRQNQCSLRGA